MKKETNIIESVEFLSEEDLMVAELDKRLSFVSVPGVCDCVGYTYNVPQGPSQPSAVRG